MNRERERKNELLITASKFSCADVALVWFCLGMCKHMDFQWPSFGIHFLAYITNVFNAQMRVHVPIQMTLLLVSIRASITFVWFFTGLKWPFKRELIEWSQFALYKCIAGIQLTCSRRCKIKFDARLNILSQSGHLIVFPVCKVICVLSIVFCVKRLLQNLHSYGLSPV